MFRSTYIPVKQDDKCGVYFSTKYFDGERLQKAATMLQNKEESADGMYLSAGNVYFDDDPELVWPVFEIYMAYKFMTVAENTGFWYSVICDDTDIPQLFLSIQFHGRCVLVNALTDHSLVLKQKAHIASVQMLVGKKCRYVYLQRLFEMLEGIYNGTTQVLSAVRVSTPEGDQYMVTNPYTYPYSDEICSYAVEALEEIDSLLKGETRKTESFEIIAAGIRRIDSVEWPVIPRETAQIIIDTFNTIVENKSNYIAIYDDGFEDYLYWSTNKRYLVRADTLECVVVKNQQVKRLLTKVADDGANHAGHLDLIWRLACQL